MELSLQHLKVSGLCVSMNRPHLLPRAIRNFFSQSHSNTELVVVTDAADRATIDIASQYTKVKVVPIPGARSQSLGELRNLCLDNASGDYVINWDDDDWCHTDRIRCQLATATLYKKPAVVLTKVIIFDALRECGFLSSSYPYGMTVLCERKTLIHHQIAYPALDKHEDSALMTALIERDLVYPLLRPQLYVYVFHKGNTMDTNHFSALFNSATRLDSLQNQTLGLLAKTGPFSDHTLATKLDSQSFSAGLHDIMS